MTESGAKLSPHAAAAPLRPPFVVLQGRSSTAAQLSDALLPRALARRWSFFERELLPPCAHTTQQRCLSSVAMPLNTHMPKQRFYCTIERSLVYEYAIMVMRSSLPPSVRVTSILVFYK